MIRALALGMLVACCACQQQRASRKDCETILARIVTIELDELGYRDPALVEVERRELGKRFDAELQACVGRSLSSEALRCVAAATSTEGISHRCLH
jgi:hypothetical protein